MLSCKTCPYRFVTLQVRSAQDQSEFVVAAEGPGVGVLLGAAAGWRHRRGLCLAQKSLGNRLARRSVGLRHNLLELLLKFRRAVIQPLDAKHAERAHAVSD